MAKQRFGLSNSEHVSQRIGRRMISFGASSGCPRVGRTKGLLQLERIEASLSIEKLQVDEQGDEYFVVHPKGRMILVALQ